MDRLNPSIYRDIGGLSIHQPDPSVLDDGISTRIKPLYIINVDRRYLVYFRYKNLYIRRNAPFAEVSVTLWNVYSSFAILSFLPTFSYILSCQGKLVMQQGPRLSREDVGQRGLS